MLIGTKKYLIISGDGDPNEILDLTNEDSKCTTHIGNYPLEVSNQGLLSNAVGAIFESKVVLCGGYLFNYTDGCDELFPSCGEYASDECYTVNDGSFFGKMQEKRFSSASAVYENKLWVTGGWDFEVYPSKVPATTEYVSLLSGISEPGPSLPERYFLKLSVIKKHFLYCSQYVFTY